MAWLSGMLHSMVARAGIVCPRTRAYAAVYEHSRGSLSTGGSVRLALVGLPALGLEPADGSEDTFFGRDGRNLGGAGARVGSLAAASLIVSMADDWRLAIEGSGLTSR